MWKTSKYRFCEIFQEVDSLKPPQNKSFKEEMLPNIRVSVLQIVSNVISPISDSKWHSITILQLRKWDWPLSRDALICHHLSWCLEYLLARIHNLSEDRLNPCGKNIPWFPRMLKHLQNFEKCAAIVSHRCCSMEAPGLFTDKKEFISAFTKRRPYPSWMLMSWEPYEEAFALWHAFSHLWFCRSPFSMALELCCRVR